MVEFPAINSYDNVEVVYIRNNITETFNHVKDFRIYNGFISFTYHIYIGGQPIFISLPASEVKVECWDNPPYDEEEEIE